MQLGGFSRTSSDSDGFVAKLRGSDLAVQWVYWIGGPGDTHATSIAVNPDGAIAVAGDFTGSLVAPGTVPSDGGRDCFVMRLTKIGLQQTLHYIGGTGDRLRCGEVCASLKSVCLNQLFPLGERDLRLAISEFVDSWPDRVPEPPFVYLCPLGYVL